MSESINDHCWWCAWYKHGDKSFFEFASASIRIGLALVEVFYCVMWECKYTRAFFLIDLHVRLIRVANFSTCLGWYILGFLFYHLVIANGTSSSKNQRATTDETATTRNSRRIPRKDPEHILLSALLSHWWKSNICTLLEQQIISSLIERQGSKLGGGWMVLSVKLKSLDNESVPIIQKLVVSESSLVNTAATTTTIDESNNSIESTPASVPELLPICYGDLVVSYRTKTEFIVEVDIGPCKGITFVIGDIRLLAGVRFGFDFSHKMSYSPQINFSILPDQCSFKFLPSELKIPIYNIAIINNIASKAMITTTENIQSTLSGLIKSVIKADPMSWPGKASLCKPVKVNLEQFTAINRGGVKQDHLSDLPSCHLPVTISDIAFFAYEKYEDLFKDNQHCNYVFISKHSDCSGNIQGLHSSRPMNFTNERGMNVCLGIRYGTRRCISRIDISGTKFIPNVISVSDYSPHGRKSFSSHSNLTIKYSPCTKESLGIQKMFIFHKNEVSNLQNIPIQDLPSYSFLRLGLLKFMDFNPSPLLKNYVLAYK